MKIKLGGAFAGYFAMVLLVFSTHKIWYPPNPFQVWTVNGRILKPDGKPLEPFNSGDVTLAPPQPVLDRAGVFSFDVTTTPDQNGGIKYPIVMITHNGYSTVPVSLDPTSSDPTPYKLIWNNGARTVTIKGLVLTPLDDYNPTAAAPALPIAHLSGGH